MNKFPEDSSEYRRLEGLCDMPFPKQPEIQDREVVITDDHIVLDSYYEGNLKVIYYTPMQPLDPVTEATEILQQHDVVAEMLNRPKSPTLLQQKLAELAGREDSNQDLN